MSSACKFITAQQFGWWLKGGEGRERNGGGEAVGPAQPALGPALAGNCNSSSGGKVSSAWLTLTSTKCCSLYSCLAVPLLNSVSFCLKMLPLVSSTIYSTRPPSYLLLKWWLKGSSLCLFLPISVVSSFFTPTNDKVSQTQWGKYVSSPRFKISPPPW